MKLLNCALVVLALSSTGCESQSSVSPQVLRVFGTVHLPDGTAVGGAKVCADAGSCTQSDPAGRFVIVVPASGGSITLRASEAAPDSPGQAFVGTRSGSVRVEGSPGRITIDIVLDRFDPI